MIDVKQAVTAAIDFAKEILDTEAGMGPITLEEVERSEDGNYWCVTLGFADTSAPTPLAAITGTKARKYKVFNVDRNTGDVVSMKMRNVS